MKKRRLFLLLLAAVLLLAACGPGPGKERITLTVMGRRSDMEKTYLQRVFSRYQEATGNRLNIVSFEDGEFETEAARAFAQGNVPDVFMHFHNADLSRFQVEENFLDLSGEGWVSDLTPSSDAYCRDSQGRLLGLPFWESSVSGCYYNKTLLEELGLRPASTQAEFDVLCQTLAEIGRVPICFPAEGCTWMYQFGLDPIFADDPALLERLNRNEVGYGDIPQVADMVQWIGNAADKGWFGSDYLTTGWDDISDKLSSGSAVMTFIWDTWFYTDFTVKGEYTVEDFALMPIFMGTAENGTYEGGNLNMMMVNKNGENVEAARAFLDFCADPENYNAAFEGISTVSCFRGQTTNIQSAMVTDAAASIASRERVSTAATKIVGYSADDVAAAVGELLRHRVDAAGCVVLMDSLRREEASG